MGFPGQVYANHHILGNQSTFVCLQIITMCNETSLMYLIMIKTQLIKGMTKAIRQTIRMKLHHYDWG